MRSIAILNLEKKISFIKFLSLQGGHHSFKSAGACCQLLPAAPR